MRNQLVTRNGGTGANSPETALWEVTNLSGHLAILALVIITVGGESCRPVDIRSKTPATS